MGNRDKGLVRYRGRSLIGTVLQVVTPQVRQVHIIANRNRQRYGAYGVPVHAEPYPATMTCSPAC